MNLATTDPKIIAERVFGGGLEIDEVPVGRRKVVAKHVFMLKKKADAKKEKSSGKGK